MFMTYFYLLSKFCFYFCSQIWMGETATQMSTTCQLYFMSVHQSVFIYLKLKLHWTLDFPCHQLHVLSMFFRWLIRAELRIGQWLTLIGLKEGGIQKHTELKMLQLSSLRVLQYVKASHSLFSSLDVLYLLCWQHFVMNCSPLMKLYMSRAMKRYKVHISFAQHLFSYKNI